jgi:hypothetical protein
VYVPTAIYDATRSPRQTASSVGATNTRLRAANHTVAAVAIVPAIPVARAANRR